MFMRTITRTLFFTCLLAAAACSNSPQKEVAVEPTRFEYSNATYQDAPITDLELSMEMHVDSLNNALEMLDQ